ncbi:helix-turn-helix transcriptional regulator [Neobacillus massiliamazoniensis]|uniref:Helix-turn-helix protein n=1 Tax=Neobacillus massiliamazoniensis TaxID=1499688 RepID=A0A0U1NQR6_9BACI|nr:helix-turn-helix transcriptional regulator [Neobacillus massiliamazoniensis]CRK80393.1 helix-turn-helix protein [Neobacillus massiliamazoniensis]
MVTAVTIKVVKAFLDLTQGELAKRMGVSVSLVSAVEQGTKPITADFAKKFKRAVGITDTILSDIQYLQTKLSE